jgi:uncharacterized protein YjbJ (UPF0337 family)
MVAAADAIDETSGHSERATVSKSGTYRKHLPGRVAGGFCGGGRWPGTRSLMTRFSSDVSMSQREMVMNWDQIQGNWKQYKGKVREQWGKLTDDDFDQVQGQREQLIGRVQERYGIARDEAERQVKDWETGL